MVYNVLPLTLQQDTLRHVSCWHFYENDTNLLQAHHDAYDMFLCPQPLLVLPEPNRSRSTRHISENATLLKRKEVQLPATHFLLNTHAIEILTGKTISEKLMNLIYLTLPTDEIVIEWITELTFNGLYIIEARTPSRKA